MEYILKVILVIVAITYSLQLVNSQSDLLVFGGLAFIGAALFYLFGEIKNLLKQIKSKL
ncbi:hypothetical protein [Dyadobacter sp. CY323]|uniref:hypothetical protein n=1 Tax=Dyadobacter sp. CY323 TaxID=2907302 RepID=UPI001F35DD92|nr:hypothetical protein [Dyadobacter sp. CY323]MCE6989911.1 hypothetical protein [Dyadobacter sp. CY323]